MSGVVALVVPSSRKSASRRRLFFHVLVLFSSALFFLVNLRASVGVSSRYKDVDDHYSMPDQIRPVTTTTTSTNTLNNTTIKNATMKGDDENNNNNNNNNKAPKASPFPRWNSSTNDKNGQGISWTALEYYMRMADQHLTEGHDLLVCRNGGCPTDMPNVLYIFGASRECMTPLQQELSWMKTTTRSHLLQEEVKEDTSMVNVTNQNGNSGDSDGNGNGNGGGGSDNNHSSSRKVYVERRRRKFVGKGFLKRYPIVEELLDRSLTQLLLLIGQEDDDEKTKYPRLRHYLQEHPAGIPMIVNLGDNRQCHVENLKWHGAWHNVPVFTLAVPVNCQYALPLPHPAALDTAQAYGTNWPNVLVYRRRHSPRAHQIPQAVWRGSPTGEGVTRRPQTPSSMRYQLVVAANTISMPNEEEWNQTIIMDLHHHHHHKSKSIDYFDVAFGKALRKIRPSNDGPTTIGTDVPGRGRIPFESFGRYRVVLDADGSSWSERFGPLLCLPTVVAKLTPNFVDWIWPEVEAGVHYLSVAPDASNLWSVVLPHLGVTTTAEHNQTTTTATTQKNEDDDNDDNDDDAQMIARANAWCASRMTYDRMIDDVLQTMEEYVTWLNQGDEAWPHKWQHFLTTQMPPHHHHWQPLPVQRPKPYFPIIRNNITD